MISLSQARTPQILKSIGLFKAFREDELKELLKSAKALHFESHANVIIEGEASWGIYIILEGMVGVFKANKMSGTVYELGQLRAGAFFGEMSLIDQNTRSATIQTLTESTLLYISKEDFNRFLNSSNDIRLRFYENCIHSLVHRFRELDEQYVTSQYQLWKFALSKDKGVAS